MDAERNLLFGILAAQLRGIHASEIVRAGTGWLAEPSVCVADRLVAAGALTDSHRRSIDALVEDAILAHGGDAGVTLEAFGGDEKASRVFQGEVAREPDGSLSLSFSVDPEGTRSPKDSFPGVPENPTRYTELGEHGRGGFGRVLSVFDEQLSREIALKELVTDREPGSARGSGSTLNPFRARFVQEARITSQLEHPSIVPVYELGRRKNGNLYYTMKFVRGKTLQSAIAEATTLDRRLKLLPHFVDLCQAIAYAHTRGVLHRDIKPVNVMIGEFGETITLDWGLATKKREKNKAPEAVGNTVRGLRLGDEAEATKSVHGEALGTPYYMPPEQALGKLDDIDERSDVYSLGVVLYELLTGRVPFEGDSALEVLRQVVNQDPPRISSIERRVPPELAAICHRAISKDAGKRYPSAKKLAEDVSRFLSGAVVDAYNYTPAERFNRFLRKNWELLTTITVAVLALMLIGGFAYYRVIDERNTALMNKRIADDARERAEHLAYLTNIRLANEQLGDGDLTSARETILTTPEELRSWEWGHLDQMANPWAYRIPVSSPEESIYATRFSPDGKHIAAMQGWRIGVHDARDGTPISSVASSDVRLNNFVWSDDSKYLALIENSGLLQVWQVEGGRLPLECAYAPAGDGPPGTPYELAFGPGGSQILVWGDQKFGVHLWNAVSGEHVRAFRGHHEEVYDGAILPEGGRAVTCDASGEMLVWNLSSGEVLHRLRGTHFQLDERSQRIFAMDGRQVYAYDWNTGTALCPPVQLEAKAIRIAISGDGKQVAVADDASAVTVFSSCEDSSPVVCQLAQNAKMITFSPNDQYLVALAGNVSVYDLKSGIQRTELKGDWDLGRYMDLHPTLPLIAVASAEEDMPAEIWSGWRWTGEDLFPKWPEPIQRAMLAPGEEWAAMSTDTGLQILDRVSHQSILRSWFGTRTSGIFVVRPDATEAVVALDPNFPVVLECATGNIEHTMSFPGEQLLAAAYNASGNQFAIGYSDGALRVWDSDDGNLAAALNSAGHVPDAVVFTQDARGLVSASKAGSVVRWDLDNAGPRWTRKFQKAEFTSIVVSPEGSEYWLGNAIGGLVVVDSETGNKKSSYETSGTNRSISWSNDGRRVLFTSNADTWLWDRTIRQRLLRIPELTGRAAYTSFARDGTSILALTGKGQIRRWPSSKAATPSDYTPAATSGEAPLFVYVADDSLLRGLQRLRDEVRFAGDIEAAASETGLRLKGLTADAMHRLGFLDGDRLFSINETALDHTHDFGDVLDRVIAGQMADPDARIRIAFERGRFQDVAELIPVPRETRKLQLRVDADDAIRLLSRKIALVKLNRVVLEQGSSDAAKNSGDVPDDSEELDGIRAMNMHYKGSDEELFQAFGVESGDRLRYVDGTHLTSIDLFVESMKKVLDRLYEGKNATIAYEVERGPFVRVLAITELVQGLTRDID